ncbi:hypothetical protein [Clostridium beijerinckii]|uniref:hypothetical protein n=1 Tax=Clostridium beijerinckii TaxID=1520 RepID=UPI000809B57C|nr:hypothetical protein [Clostridium beijerinckii]OCA98726.1 hypothetical protein BGS1_22865 [Clostridium beijerinckii]
MKKETYNLISRSKEELITLINELMYKLPEKERIEFVSKWISPEIALMEAGINDRDGFIKRVEVFCKECLDRQYYIEPEYEYYHDHYYGEEGEDYSESEWACQFTELLEISIMFSRNRNYDVSINAFETLMKCLHEAEFDEEILGTDIPRDYIDVDWNEAFLEYYSSIKNQVVNDEDAANKAIEVWINFGEICTEGILSNFNNNPYIEKVIRENIKDNGDYWAIQHILYELLKKFYLKQNREFDEIIMAKSLISYNPNFSNDVAQGYINKKMWSEAVKTIEVAIKEVKNVQIISSLNEKLVDCFENLYKFNEAYEVAVKMFKNDSSHELYLRARNLAVKTGELHSFIDNMLKFIKSSKRYDSISIILRILSFEGNTLELINTALKSKDYSRHDYLKYTTKSLIYRVLIDKNIKFDNLQEFIQEIKDNKIDGIVDMVKNPKGYENEYQLLTSSVDILKEMVQFHIDAAQRSRYARAAYYCSIIKDVYNYINEKENFNRYYSSILKENNRRPALKDEMKKRIF